MPVFPDAPFFKPCLKLRYRLLFQQLPDTRHIVIAGGLIHQHNIIRLRQSHHIVNARRSQKCQDRLRVVLIGRHVVRITYVAAHRQSVQMPAEYVLKRRPCELLGVVDILRPHETYHRVHQKRMIVPCQTVTSAFHRLLIAAERRRGRQFRTLPGLKIHDVGSLCRSLLPKQHLRLRQHPGVDAKRRERRLRSRNRLETQIGASLPGSKRLHLCRHM